MNCLLKDMGGVEDFLPERKQNREENFMVLYMCEHDSTAWIYVYQLMCWISHNLFVERAYVRIVMRTGLDGVTSVDEIFCKARKMWDMTIANLKTRSTEQNLLKNLLTGTT